MITSPPLQWVPSYSARTPSVLTRPTRQGVSFTEGAAPVPQGYIKLSPDRFAAIHARTEAASALPYLVGSGPVVARSYEDETLADSTYNQW